MVEVAIAWPVYASIGFTLALFWLIWLKGDR